MCLLLPLLPLLPLLLATASRSQGSAAPAAADTGSAASSATPAVEAEPSPAPGLPTWEALEAAGTRIGEIRVLNRDIFDLGNPKENNALFRLANRLHIQTRAGVIERQLLIRTGEVVSARRIAETERVLRSNRYL